MIVMQRSRDEAVAGSLSSLITISRSELAAALARAETARPQRHPGRLCFDEGR